MSDGLVEGARAAIREMGGSLRDVAVFDVPGAFELPLAARAAALSGRFDAVVALGAVIQGETDHYEHVAREAAVGPRRRRARDRRARRLRRAHRARGARRPSGARSRARSNKGAEAARAAVMLVRALRAIERRGGWPAGRAGGPRRAATRRRRA